MGAGRGGRAPLYVPHPIPFVHGQMIIISSNVYSATHSAQPFLPFYRLVLLLLEEESPSKEI